MRRFVRHTSTIAAVFISLGILGCEKSDERRSPDAVKPRAAGPSAGGGFGTVRGTVSLRGEPPIMREIANQPCHPGATPLREETVVADEKGRLANVVVFLHEAPTTPSPRPLQPVEFDQQNYRYVPHVLALRAGQVLRVKTSDPAVHNVHFASSVNPPRNIGMRPGSSPVDLTFQHPEDITFKCDIHPWMNARVHVFEHGQFAVTKADGSFELNHVPAGQYTLVFRHELFGDLEEVIELADQETLAKDAVYEKPE
jgi:plastocyanin